MLRNAIAWIKHHGYQLWSNGIGYWVFTGPSTDVPGDMGIYIGYVYPIDLLCMADDLRELAYDTIWEEEAYSVFDGDDPPAILDSSPPRDELGRPLDS